MVVLRSGNGLVFGPFYGEARPRLSTGPRLLAVRLSPPARERLPLSPGGNLTDFGTLVQGGYFFVPKKLEIVGRYSMIESDSGDINGTGRCRTVSLTGITGPVRVIDGAFRNFHQAREYAVGFNYFFYGQLVKWSSDFSVYQGGNPAAGGASPAGFIAGVDGWMVRSQIQLAF